MSPTNPSTVFGAPSWAGVVIPPERRSSLLEPLCVAALQFAQDSGIWAVDGLTGNTTVRVRATHTLGGAAGAAMYRYAVATLYRIR